MGIRLFTLLFLFTIHSESAAAEGQTSTAMNKSSVIVAFGDSNTGGTNWNTNNYDVKDKWVNKLQRSYTVINAGIAGHTSENGRIRFAKDVLNKNPKAVIIMFGTNDAILNTNSQPRVSKARFQHNLNYFIDTLKARKVEVILMTTPPIIQGNNKIQYYYSRHDQNLYTKYNGARQWHDSYNAIIRTAAKQQNVFLIDNYANMTQSMDGITDRKLIQSGLIDTSGTHLTPQGSDVIYRSVNAALHKVLAQKSR
ncbi:SGNH/GDSL hydrolase family protein [Bacillus sp. B190/17]|uniref:SGNH/GDSL hydrolase family protein n=1 Tax=Bacillus lumedeiriae TaxID=3058829 RepID=A0ABW8IAH7_9BACI